MKRAICILFSTFLALIVAELGIQLLGTDLGVSPAELNKKTLRYDRSLFTRSLLPEEFQRVKNEFAPHDVFFTINSLGYRRTRPITQPKNNTFRVMIFGGSSVFDLLNTDNTDWPSRVEKIFQEDGLDNVEVINAGIPGHASFDSVGRLFADSHLLSPDVVMYYGAWNDIKLFQDSRPLIRKIGPLDLKANPFRSYRNTVDRFFSENSEIYVSLRTYYFLIDLNIGPEGLIIPPPENRGIKDNAILQYKLNLETFVDVARNRNILPILITEGRLVAKNNSESERKKIAYDFVHLTHEELCDAFETTDRVLYQVSKEKDVALIDASSVMSGNDEYFNDHIHTTSKGSAILAEIVAEKLRDLVRGN